MCFGSLGAFCGEQVKEIAHALERTGERFMWSLRRPTGDGAQLSNPKNYDDFAKVLPEGFLDRTADVGRVMLRARFGGYRVGSIDGCAGAQSNRRVCVTLRDEFNAREFMVWGADCDVADVRRAAAEWFLSSEGAGNRD
ncbi:UDP-glucose flavonoid 3-O-glucosyltransferase 6 [Linum perenne]